MSFTRIMLTVHFYDYETGERKALQNNETKKTLNCDEMKEKKSGSSIIRS